LATDRIKVSQLPLINSQSLSINDVFIINDSDRGDGQTITSGIKYSDVIGSLSQQDFNFTGDITFTGDVLFNGSISPSPGKELNLSLDNLTINDSITIGPTADISGIKLSDLDDTLIVSQVGNQLLIWDQGEQAWRNFTLQQIIDLAPEISFENVTDINMSGDLTVGGDLSVSGNISGIGLNDLDDVRTPTPITDRRFLRWDQTTQQWIPSMVEVTDINGGIANPPADGGVYGRAFVSGDFDWVEVAPIDSPVFTGTPTCPTPEASDPALSIVNKQYVTDVLTGSIGGITLDSLDDVEAANPADGEALVYDDSAGVWVPGEVSSPVSVATSSARPTNPSDGELWFNTDEGILYVWEDNNANWIDVRPGPDSTIKVEGYDVPGPIKIQNLITSGIPSKNDYFIVEQTDDSGQRITKSISWKDMVKPLLDRIEELERRLG